MEEKFTHAGMDLPLYGGAHCANFILIEI